jgi:DNA-binding PadR family transcriptional regulator
MVYIQLTIIEQPMPNESSLKPQWFQILLALSAGPLHGTAVMEEVLARTAGEMKLWPTSLYGSLRDLEQQGWIAEADPPADAPTEGGRRRFYHMTPSGQEALAAEARRMASYLEVARARNVLGGAGPA